MTDQEKQAFVDKVKGKKIRFSMWGGRPNYVIPIYGTWKDDYFFGDSYDKFGRLFEPHGKFGFMTGLEPDEAGDCWELVEDDTKAFWDPAIDTMGLKNTIKRTLGPGGKPVILKGGGDKMKFNNCKVYVPTPEISEMVQEKLVELGYGSGLNAERKISRPFNPYIYICERYFLFGFGDVSRFKDHPHREISLSEILLEETKKLKVGSLDYPVIIKENHVAIGCQKISHSDAFKIAEFIKENISYSGGKK